MVSSARIVHHCLPSDDRRQPFPERFSRRSSPRERRIATQDDRQSFVDALAIKDGRIHATGDAATVMAYRGAATRVCGAETAAR